jgi:hypothetical protein
MGPFNRWCGGEMWVSPAVSARTTTTPPGTTVTEPTEPTKGVVESTSAVITTPAGTFDCIVTRVEITEGESAGAYTRTWISKAHSVMVKMDIYTPDGERIGFSEATSID